MGWVSRCWRGLVAVALVGCGAAGGASGPPGVPSGAASAPPPPSAASAGAPPTVDLATLQKVVMALPVASGTLTPHVLAQQKGFFRAEGLDVELPIMRSNLISAAMTAGEVDYDGSISPAVRNALSGVPTRVIIATVNKSTRRVMAAPGIQSMEQLRGKTIAIPGIGGGLYNSGVLALEAYGIDPHTEVIWLPVPGLAERFLTLQQGIAQGSIFSGPEVPRAEAMGFPTLVALNAVAPLPESGIATTVAKLESQRDETRRVLRAVIRALQ